nr:AIG1-like protein [Tanacetum cinerariifolium]
LKLHLQRELLVSKPTTLDDVFSLARIIEARFDDQGTSMAETTYDNDARDQVSELEMKVLVDGKQVEAKVVKVAVVVVEQNINEPDVK